jgi:O-methyltransferase
MRRMMVGRRGANRVSTMRARRQKPSVWMTSALPSQADNRSSVAAELYLDLLKQCLTRVIFPERYRVIDPERGTLKRMLFEAHRPLRRLLRLGGMELVRRIDVAPEVRVEGRDIPGDAETMVGLQRLDNLHDCIRAVLADDVPGDLLEAGVWRGGATIFMRGALAAYGDEERCVWAADSFAGLPKGDRERYPADSNDRFWRNPHLSVSLDQVKENFRRYRLLDERVRFLEGWFRDTLPRAPVERLAVLRLDADMYESTAVALDALYPRVSVGGYVIVDDYGEVPEARKAADDFRAAHGVKEPLVAIDRSGVYWRRSA